MAKIDEHREVDSELSAALAEKHRIGQQLQQLERLRQLQPDSLDLQQYDNVVAEHRQVDQQVTAYRRAKHALRQEVEAELLSDQPSPVPPGEGDATASPPTMRVGGGDGPEGEKAYLEPA